MEKIQAAAPCVCSSSSFLVVWLLVVFEFVPTGTVISNL